jgi:prevent-host-death family protein
MNTLHVAAADAKEHLSDYLTRSAHGECRVVVTRRGRPMAAIVSMEDLQVLEQAGKREGLATVAGKWKGFDEIADQVEAARSTGGSCRDVSL